MYTNEHYLIVRINPARPDNGGIQTAQNGQISPPSFSTATMSLATIKVSLSLSCIIEHLDLLFIDSEWILNIEVFARNQEYSTYTY